MKLTALCLLLSLVVTTTSGYKTAYLPGYYCGKDYKMDDDEMAVMVESSYLRTSDEWTYRSDLDKYECAVTFENGNDDYNGLMMKFGMFKADCGDHIEIFSGRGSYADPDKRIMDCNTAYYSSVFRTTSESGVITVRILSDSDTMLVKFNFTLVVYNDYDAYEDCDVKCEDENVCIDKSLCKDGIDHCFDNSDEKRYANCDAIDDVHWNNKDNKWEEPIVADSWSWWRGVYSYAVIGGIVVAVISIIVSIVCCCIRYKYAHSRTTARTYSTPATSVTYAAGGGGYPVQPPPATVSYPPGSYPVQQPPPGSYPQQQPGNYMQPGAQPVQPPVYTALQGNDAAGNPNAEPPVYEELKNPTYDNAGETKANPV